MPPRPSIAHTLVLLALGSAAPLGAQTPPSAPQGTPRVMLGPMLGAVRPEGARIWAQVSGAYEVRVVHGDEPELRDARRSAAVLARGEDDYCVQLELTGLEPGREVHYRIEVDGAVDKYLRALPPFRFRMAPSGPARFRVAFGSCARVAYDRVQPIWNAVQAVHPELFFWLGDNIYGDALDPRVLAQEYKMQRAVASLQPLLPSVAQLAIWDDHDFGLNDYDRRHPRKREALEVLARHWANPPMGTPEAPGCFFAYSYGGVDFFFLDGRSYRDPNGAADGPAKTMLGTAQLAWLQERLRSSRAAFKILACGSGWSAAKGPGGDSWASFLHERDALFDFVREASIEGVVLLSGDTHVSELNAIPASARGGYDLYDLVSSPLAQVAETSWRKRRPELRIRPVHDRGESFGVLDFDLTLEDPRLVFTPFDRGGRAASEPFELRASELRNGIVSWPAKITPTLLRELEAQGLPGEAQRTLPERGVCAHRGASATHPENTLAALREAVRLGAAMIEFDVRATRDGALVLLHDAKLERTTNGSGSVAERTLEELRSLDAGAWKDARFAGERIPTLEEALAVLPHDLWLNVHVKGDRALGRATAELLRAQRRIAQSFVAGDPEAVQGARDAVPTLRTANLDRRGGLREHVERCLASRSAFAQLRGELDESWKALRAHLRADGVRLAHYGATTPAEWRMLWENGIDFVLADDVEAALRVARELGLAAPLAELRR
ncbi:MAG: alkaline phosphatase D family protein [Planctomycetes bacterium]|nr:alkaline phosphatase D family protein [Planctomycetota bacterium]